MTTPPIIEPVFKVELTAGAAWRRGRLERAIVHPKFWAVGKMSENLVVVENFRLFRAEKPAFWENLIAKLKFLF